MNVQQQLTKYANTVAGADGTATFTFDPVDAGWVWEGSIFVTGAGMSPPPPTATFIAAANNVPWGSFTGIQPLFVQGWPPQQVKITATGLAPGAPYTANWVGAEIPVDQAVPKAPAPIPGSSGTPGFSFILPGTNELAVGIGAGPANNADLPGVINGIAPGYRWNLATLSFGYDAAPAAKKLFTITDGAAITYSYPLTTTSFWLEPLTGADYGLMFEPNKDLTFDLPASGSAGVNGYVNITGFMAPTKGLG